MRLTLLIAAGSTALAAACGSDVTDRACAAGHQTACVCTNGQSGAQTCKADESAYDPCVCEGSVSSSGSAGSTSTGGQGGASSSSTAGSSAGGAGASSTGGAGGSAGSSALWSKRFGDVADHQGAFDLALDGAANVSISGMLGGTMDFGNGPMTGSGAYYDLYFAKFTAAGDPLWSKHVPGSLQNPHLGANMLGDTIIATDVNGLVDFGGGLLLGSDAGQDVAVVALDPAGNQIWAHRWVSTSYTAFTQAMAVMPTNDVFVVGYYGGSIDVGCGPLAPTPPTSPGVFVTKLSPAGACAWSKTYSGSITVGSIALGATGDIYAAGFGSGDFGGGPTAESGVFLERSSPDGTHLFTKTWPGTSNNPPAMVALPNGNLVITGSFTVSGGNPPPCGMDFGNGLLLSDAYEGAYIVMVDPNGTALWSKTYGPAGTSGRTIALDPAGNLVTTGVAFGPTDFGTGTIDAQAGGVYVVHLDTSGNTLSAKIYEGGQSSHAGVDALGNVYIAGDLYGTGDFGSGSLVSAGGTDAYLANVGP